MFCRKCGKEVAEDVRFCPNCGEDQWEESEKVEEKPVEVKKEEKQELSGLLLAAKVLIIITMILAFWAIFPLVLGIFAIKAIENNENPKDLLTWSIVTLLLVNTIAGILMLVYSVKDE